MSDQAKPEQLPPGCARGTFGCIAILTVMILLVVTLAFASCAG